MLDPTQGVRKPSLCCRVTAKAAVKREIKDRKGWQPVRLHDYCAGGFAATAAGKAEVLFST